MNNIETRGAAITELAAHAHKTAVKHGFYDDYMELCEELMKADAPLSAQAAQRDFVLAQLAKIASEVGECVDVIQKKPDYEGLAEELADIVIRTMDLSAFLGYDLGTHVVMKMTKNESRPYKHGKLC